MADEGKIKGTSDVERFNEYCKTLHEGDILYNIDSTNLWGEYLIVLVKHQVRTENGSTWFVMLSGARREKDSFRPTSLKVYLSPDKIGSCEYLKYIGHCKVTVTPEFGMGVVNKGLVAVYKGTDLWRYSRNTHCRKVRNRKYDDRGNPIKREDDK